jgi:hypothetical protein
MLLGFKKLFAPFVEEGSKTHTIRAIRKIPPRVGEICHCYTGLRTKKVKLLGRWPCVRVEPVNIEFVHCGLAYILQITIAGEVLSNDEAENFAWRDGFRPEKFARTGMAALDLMAGFWEQEHGLSFGSAPFEGTLIHWEFKPGTANAKPKAAKRRAGGKAR